MNKRTLENQREEKTNVPQHNYYTAELPSSKKMVSCNEHQNLSDQSKPFKEDLNEILVNFYLFMIELENFNGFDDFMSSTIYRRLKKNIFIIVTNTPGNDCKSKLSFDELWVNLDFLKFSLQADFLSYKTPNLYLFGSKNKLGQIITSTEFKTGYLICLGETNVIKSFSIELNQSSISDIVQSFLVISDQSKKASLGLHVDLHVSESEKRFIELKKSKANKENSRPIQRLLIENLDDLLRKRKIQINSFCLMKFVIRQEKKAYQQIKSDFSNNPDVDRLPSLIQNCLQSISLDAMNLEIRDYIGMLQDLDYRGLVPHDQALDIREFLIDIEIGEISSSEKESSNLKGINSKAYLIAIIEEIFVDFLKGNIRIEEFLIQIQKVIDLKSQKAKEVKALGQSKPINISNELIESPIADPKPIFTFNNDNPLQSSLASPELKVQNGLQLQKNFKRKNSDFRRVKKAEFSDNLSYHESEKAVNEDIPQNVIKKIASSTDPLIIGADNNQLEEMKKTLMNKTVHFAAGKPKILFDESQLVLHKNGSGLMHLKDIPQIEFSDRELDVDTNQTKLSQRYDNDKQLDDQSFNDRDAQNSFFVENLNIFLKAHISSFTKTQYDYLMRISVKNDDNVLSAFELYEIENDENELIETLISICNASNIGELQTRKNDSFSSQRKSNQSPLNRNTPDTLDNFKQAVETKNKNMTMKISMNSVQDQNYNNSIISSGNTETLFSFKQCKQKDAEDPNQLIRPSSKNSIKVSSNCHSGSSAKIPKGISSASSFTENLSNDEDNPDFSSDNEGASPTNLMGDFNERRECTNRNDSTNKVSSSMAPSSPRSKYSNSIRKDLVEPKFTLEQSMYSLNRDDRLSLSQNGYHQGGQTHNLHNASRSNKNDSKRYSPEEASPSSVINLNSSFHKNLIFEKLKTSFAHNRQVSHNFLNLNRVKVLNQTNDNSLIEPENNTIISSMRFQDFEKINEILYGAIDTKIRSIVHEVANNIILLHRNTMNEKHRAQQEGSFEHEENNGVDNYLRPLPMPSEEDRNFEKRFRELLKINMEELFPFIVKFKYDPVNQMKTLENFKSIILRVKDFDETSVINEELKRNRVNCFHRTLLEVLKVCKYISSSQIQFFTHLVNFDEVMLLAFLEVLLLDSDVNEYVDSLFIYQEMHSSNVNYMPSQSICEETENDELSKKIQGISQYVNSPIEKNKIMYLMKIKDPEFIEILYTEKSKRNYKQLSKKVLDYIRENTSKLTPKQLPPSQNEWKNHLRQVIESIPPVHRAVIKNWNELCAILGKDEHPQLQNMYAIWLVFAENNDKGDLIENLGILSIVLNKVNFKAEIEALEAQIKAHQIDRGFGERLIYETFLLNTPNSHKLNSFYQFLTATADFEEYLDSVKMILKPHK